MLNKQNKYLGQHFLKNKKILEEMARAAEISKKDIDVSLKKKVESHVNNIKAIFESIQNNFKNKIQQQIKNIQFGIISEDVNFHLNLFRLKFLLKESALDFRA